MLESQPLSSTGIIVHLLTKQAGLILVALAAVLENTASAIDTDPLDYVAPLPRTNATALYLYGLQSNEQYFHGDKVASNTLDVQSAVGMIVRFHDVGGYVLGTKLLLPYTDLTLDDGAQSRSASGLGDPILVAPLWLINRPKSRTYFAINSYLQLPLGDYDKYRVLNPGANRFSYTLQPGTSFGLGEKTTLDVVADAQVFGENGDIAGGGALRRDPLYSAQAHVTQQLTASLSVSAGVYHYWGGETEVRGIKQHDSVDNTTVIGTMTWWFLKNTSALLQYRTDTGIENGAKIDGFQFRLLYLF